MSDFLHYIGTQSFSRANELGKDDFCDVIEQLQQAHVYARECGDEIKLTGDIYEASIWDNKDFSQICYQKPFELDRDHRKALQFLFDHSKDDQITSDELVEQVRFDEKSGVTMSIFSSDELVGVAEEQVITNLDDLYFFYRHFSVLMANVEEELFSYFPRCFPDLHFSLTAKDSMKSLEGSFEKFKKPIVYALAALNDLFFECYTPKDRAQTLSKFSVESNIKTTAEAERKKGMREARTFKFLVPTDGRGTSVKEIDVFCEPHMKLHKSSAAGDSKFYHNRIYFREEHGDVEGKILVGHVGGHL